MNRRQAKKQYKKTYGHNPTVKEWRFVPPGKEIGWAEGILKTINLLSELIGMLKGEEPVVVTARSLTERRKYNPGNAWRKARRYR